MNRKVTRSGPDETAYRQRLNNATADELRDELIRKDRALECLYGIASHIDDNAASSIEQLMAGILELLPGGFIDSGMVCACAEFDERPIKPARELNRPAWVENIEIAALGRKAGVLKVCHAQSKGSGPEHGPFTPSERRFLQAVAERMGKLVERQRASEELELARQQLAIFTRELEFKNIALKRALTRAEEAGRLKGEFLANMSHEIRTPMNAILGLTEMLMDTELSMDQQTHLQMVYSSAEALLMIINDILDFSKIEAGKLELAPSNFNLHALVRDTAGVMSVQTTRKGLDLAHSIDPAVPEFVVGDPGRLKQVLMNLIGNAVKFTLKGGIAIGVSLLRSEDGVATLRFSVTDTGIGVAPGDREKIFESFGQGRIHAAVKRSGTGLGLAICARLVSMMNGSIWVESEPGRGSVFYFTVALGLGHYEPPQSAPHGEDLSGMGVMVVDYDPGSRAYLAEIIRRWDMIPHLKSNCAEAEDAMRGNAAGNGVRVVLLNSNVPDARVFDAVDRLRAAHGSEDGAPKFIMITSQGTRGDDVRCMSHGVSAYLTKPVMQSVLFDAINTAVNGVRDECGREDLITRHSLRENLSPARVLLVEDNEINQKLAVRILQKAGHEVSLACNGQIALGMIERWDYDVVLMDVQMPVMDGLEATRRIRRAEMDTGRRLPVVAMTAHAMTGDRETCLSAGMDEYISKPLKARKLLDLVDRFHDRR